MPRIFSRIPSFRTAGLAVVLSAVVGVVACSDPLSLVFNSPNGDQTFRVYALSGTPVTDPNGLYFASRSIVRVDGNFAFDLAFDIDPQGNPVILPVGLVGTPLGGTSAIGLKRVTGGYEGVTEAPRDGYVFDSVMVVAPRAAIVVQAQQQQCAGSFTPYIFVKIAFDSVDVVTRALYGKTMINLNCGSRQLIPGVPKF